MPLPGGLWVCLIGSCVWSWFPKNQQPRHRRKGPGELRCEKERAARHRADAAQDQNAKTTSDNINESTGAVDSNDGNIEKGTDGAVESKNSNGAVLVPTDQVESDGTTKDIAEETVDPVVEHSVLAPTSPNIIKVLSPLIIGGIPWEEVNPLRNLYLPW